MMGKWWALLGAGPLLFAFSCGGDDGGGSGGSGGSAAGGGSGGSGASGGSGGGTVTPVELDPSDYTYTLEESSALWTTPATRRLSAGDTPPDATRSGLHLSAAKNEFEPAQLVLAPGSGTVTVSIAAFPNLGSAQRVELGVVRYQAGLSEVIEPLQSGDSVSLDSGNVPLWITVYVPEDAPAGVHETTLTLSGAVEASVPVELTVFDFVLPKEIHFATQLNVNVNSLAGDGGEATKDLLYEHRFTPKSVTWPSGFNPSITWDSGANPQRCSAFYDEPDEGDQYAIGALAKKYVLGEGWNGVGFPNAMGFQFVDNSTPRPASFCGESRGDHYGSSAYNGEWSAFLSGLGSYLAQEGLDEKVYYYVQNEPQNDADHALAAHLCRLTKAAAPNLRIAISEEPKPEIAEDAGGACGWDIWIAHVRAYEENYAWQRQRDHGEQVWYYSLDKDPEPYFNPVVDEAEGIEARIIPWAAWSHRIRGWAYYDMGRFFHSGRPGVRAELMREGFEDYEYLWLAAGGKHPGVDDQLTVDDTVSSVASSMTSWTRQPDALMALRHELGLYLEGSRADLPVLESGGGVRERGAYYLNFQDPGGAPAADPLQVDGKTWLKVGWSEYDADEGLGWYGENVGTNIVMTGYDDVGGYSEVEKSYVYDDYGRNNLFEFDLENGRYEVTVAVGRPARGYPGDPHNVSVEGTVLVDDEATTDQSPQIVRTTTVDLTDGKLSLEVGGKSASSGDWAYTFLAYVAIEPVDG